MRRLWALWWRLCLAVAVLVAPQPAVAGPNEGEAREITRDADRPYTVVAGEGDGASTVTNPANLGYLRGVNGIIDLSWTARDQRRRGSGVGAFVGIPLPFEILSLGLGYQYLYRVQPPGGSNPSPQESQDDPFSKITLAFAVPLMRWARGLSVGLGYSRLFSSNNQHAKRVNQLDVAISWWPTRFLAMGLVGRTLNVPDTGSDRDVGQTLVVDPEIAVRPIGTPVLEFAAGVRIAPRRPNNAPGFRPHLAQPRGRVFLNIRGIKVFAEAERFRHLNVAGPMGLDLGEKDAVRISAGVEVNFGHVGFAAAPMMAGNVENTFAAQGASGRLRISQERYVSPLPPRPRRVTRLALSDYRGERGMWRAIQLIEELGKRREQILVEPEGMRLGWAQAEEVREALLRFRARGGKSAAYLKGGGLRHYFVAAATDRIIAHPTAGLNVVGMRARTLYFADLLAKLGARAEFVRIAQYKGTPEKYERSTATGPVARQRKQYFTDVWNHAIRLIAQDRGQDPLVISRWIDAAPYDPPRALRRGIVDELAYPDELDEKLEAWLGKKIRLEKPNKQKIHRDDFGPRPRIAVIYVDGDMTDGKSFTIPLLGRRIAGSESITEAIRKVRKDPSVRAVVLRVNTSGGMTSAADAIGRELDLTRKTKPVVVSMANIAASAGYHISASGQYIFADATTATGSIGIFYPKVDLSGTFAKFGVGIDEINLGKRAGLRSWLKPYTADERAAAMRDIQAGYDDFVARVGRARNMDPTQVDKVARGRVWSGVRAVDVGLVDSYGGLLEAIARARATAGMRPGEGSVVEYPKEPGILENLRRLFGVDIPFRLGRASRDAGGLGATGPFAEATRAGTLGLPTPLLLVLRHLPASLWMLERPQPLMLDDATMIVD